MNNGSGLNALYQSQPNQGYNNNMYGQQNQYGSGSNDYNNMGGAYQNQN